jgi:hypothetical protein
MKSKRIQITTEMINAATEALADDGVFSDDWGNTFPDPVASEHALSAALRAAGYVVQIHGTGSPTLGSPYRISGRA